MKKILSLVLVVVMAFCFSTVATAEVAEISFPMTVSTGYITLKGTEMVSTSMVPNTAADDYIVIAETVDAPDITSVRLTIEGERYNTSYVAKTEYDFENYMDSACTIPATKVGEGIYWKLPIKTVVASTNHFLVTSFSRIFTIGITATSVIETVDEKTYCEWGTTTLATPIATNFTVVRGFANASNVTDVITDAINAIRSFKFAAKEVQYDYPFIPATDRNNDGMITRDEVQILSYSTLGYGLGLQGFEGLTSQVATFFNKQTNGTITFKVTTAPTTTSTAWIAGGVPSTQLGIFNPGVSVSNNIFGLFVNYDSTGSLVSVANLQPDGSITFDISNILKDMDGNTVSSIRNIYYGLVGGIGYSNQPVKGYKIDKVILAYDNFVEEISEPVVTTTTTTTTVVEEDDIIIVTDEDEDEDEDTTIIDEDDDEDDEDVSIIEDEDDDADVNNDTYVVEEDEDTNPATGTALALIPLIGAGAIVVITSKKRK